MSHVPTEDELGREFDRLAANEFLVSFSNWTLPNTGKVLDGNKHLQFAEYVAEEFFEAADSALGDYTKKKRD